MRAKIALIGILSLSVTFSLNAQFSVRPDAHAAASPVITMDDLQTAAHRYFRDTAELPLVQTTTFSVTDHSGRARKPKTITTTYVFHGYSKAQQAANGIVTASPMWVMLHGSKMLKISAGSDMWSIIPGLRLYEDAYSMQIGRSGNSNGSITAEFTPIKPCPPFTMTKFPERYLPDHSCGPSEFQIGKDLMFQKFSSDIPGLPAPVKLDPFGLCTLRTYHTDITFQSVNLPAEKEPFLVPKEVTATLESDKGTIVSAAPTHQNKSQVNNMSAPLRCPDSFFEMRMS